MSEAPIQLDYATPQRAAKPPIRKSVIVATAAVPFAFLGLLMPPVVGSGRLGPNVFWAPTWWIAFALVDAYVWLRIGKSKPSSAVGALLTGIGTTGALLTLALMLVEWKPNLPLLATACAISSAVAAVGRWITARRTGPAGPDRARDPQVAECPAGQ